jgi:hypothetical protein
MTVFRKLLVSLVIVGAATTTLGSGTFASFSASTTNPTNTFATGTIVLSNTKGVATSCFSTGGGTTDSNSNGTCSSLFTLSLQKPGDSGFVDLTLKNEGTLNATSLVTYASQTCDNSDASGTSYHGSGLPCASIQLYVQEYTSDANRTANTTTGGVCQYGVASGSACSFDATKTLATFASSYPSSSTTLSMGSLAAGASRYLRIYLQLPSSATNAMQGRQAAFGFTWSIAQ